MLEYDVRWRCWSVCDLPQPTSRLSESRAVVDFPSGSEIAANVVWQQAANNDRGCGLWTEDEVVVEIVEPAEYAGHYRVEIKITCSTSGREMTTDEVRAEYAELQDA